MGQGAKIQIILRNGQGYLGDVPGDLMEKIQKATRFKPVGYQYSPQYKRFVGSGDQRRRVWDGWVNLAKHQKFPAGLLERITTILEKNKIEYAVIQDEEREYPEISVDTTGLESRYYQDAAVEKALLYRRGVIRAPTGSGKTAMIARVIEGHALWAVVIVPTIDLLNQTREFLGEHLIGPDAERIGQLGDGVVDPQPVTVATVRTMAKALSVSYESYEFGEYDDSDDTKVRPADLREWIEKLGTMIVDEAHILGAQAIFDVATKLPTKNKYGFSASPWRDDGADLMIEGATGPVRFRIGTKELVENGYLVPPMIRVIDTEGMWIPAAWKKNEYQKAYTKEIVENPVRNGMIALEANKLDVPTLILVKQVKHGKILEKIVDDSKFLSGKASGQERVEVYDQMKSGELKVIIATTIADLGLDLPICGALILAGGGKSSTRHLQRIGRVARPYPGKKAALVIDFDDTSVHKWFRNHAAARRKIEKEEWGDSALWI